MLAIKHWRCTPRRLFTATFALILLGYSSNAQDKSSAQKSSAIQWQLDATVDGVRFYHALSNCDGNKVVFLKMDNTNKFKVEVSWNEQFTTQYEQAAEGFRGQKKLVLGLGETIETSCIHPAQKQLLVLPEHVTPTYKAELRGFSYKGITVSRIK